MTLSLESSDTNAQNLDAQFDLLVHKTPTCGCCKKWVDHMEENGFFITTEDHQSLTMIKDDLQIQLNLGHVILVFRRKVIFLKVMFQANT